MKNEEVKDIVPELFEKIDKTFKLKAKESKIIKDKLKVLKNNKANYKDANEFAVEVGKILVDTFRDKIKTGDLPDGKMYYNIAKRLIEPNMVRNHDLVSEYSKEVQNILNKQAKISIQAQKADLNQDRIDKLVDKITKYDSYDDGKWLLNEPIINFTQAVVDETVRKNADLHAKAGLSPKIERYTNGKCCDWCDKLAGIYNYEDVKDTGNEVFRRHRHCDCLVIYDPKNGSKRRNVHTHKPVDNNTEKEKRIKLNEEKISQDKIKKILKTDVGFNSVDNSIYSIDETLLKDNTEQIKNLEEKFGAIHKSKGSISSKKTNNAIAYVSRSFINPSNQDLVLNIDYYSDRNKTINERASAIKNKWSMPAKSENYGVYTITHEYGHILQNSIVHDELEKLGGFESFKTRAKTLKGKIKSYEKLQEKIKRRHFEEIRQIAADKSSDPYNLIKNNLSQYGKTNYAEFFAEVFANSQLGESNELGDAMNEWLKERGY